MNILDAVNADPKVAEANEAALNTLAEIRIAEWWTRADLEEKYPTTDAIAVKLCQSVDYAITCEDLARFRDVGAFQAGSFKYGRWEMSARDVCQLAIFCECRRSWKPGSEIHESKKTACELALENLRLTGQSHEMFHDLEQFDLRSLLLMLVESDARMQRELLKCAIEIKLESFDIVV